MTTRITPACAGKRRRFQTHRRCSTGSPPRVRGKEVTLTSASHALGITPACAGKRKHFPHGRQRHQDHPRVCGEKLLTFFSFTRCVGSPPRVRGKAVWKSLYNHLDRITPACAGKRARPRTSYTQSRDHPRVCGEKSADSVWCFYVSGSPPRVRGKGELAAHRRGRDGITPACAGKRPFVPRFCGGSWDHPRVCGEKEVCGRHRPQPLGSPPRVRGKVVYGNAKQYLTGITPACAGKRNT